MNIEQIAREAGDDWDSTQQRDKDFLERFATLYREALIAELVAGSGEPVIGLSTNDGMDFYTADQLAGAVLRERERCAQIVEQSDWNSAAKKAAAAIRSGA